jgi:hypothetical protein
MRTLAHAAQTLQRTQVCVCVYGTVCADTVCICVCLHIPVHTYIHTLTCEGASQRAHTHMRVHFTVCAECASVYVSIYPYVRIYTRAHASALRFAARIAAVTKAALIALHCCACAALRLSAAVQCATTHHCALTASGHGTGRVNRGASLRWANPSPAKDCRLRRCVAALPIAY